MQTSSPFSLRHCDFVARFFYSFPLRFKKHLETHLASATGSVSPQARGSFPPQANYFFFFFPVSELVAPAKFLFLWFVTQEKNAHGAKHCVKNSLIVPGNRSKITEYGDFVRKTHPSPAGPRTRKRMFIDSLLLQKLKLLYLSKRWYLEYGGIWSREVPLADILWIRK